MQSEFTLSYHFYAQRDHRNHLELFLDIDGHSELETWQSFGKQSRIDATWPRKFTGAAPHRRIYLDFYGKLTGNRGRLRILRRGKFIDRRTGMSEGRIVQDVHPSATRRTRCPRSSRLARQTVQSIKVTF